jgi:hypothetical protein
MISEKELQELQVLFVTQNDLLSKMKSKFDDIEVALESNEDTAMQIIHVQEMMDEILNEIHLLSMDELSVMDHINEEITNIYRNKQVLINDDLKKLEFNNWDEFVQKSFIYNISNELDPFVPYETFLTANDLNLLKQESYKNLYKWDRWDYLFVGLAGFLGALIDVFIVAIPKDMTNGTYKGQTGSSLTKWLQNLEFPEWVQKWLEEIAKVPYDRTGGSSHRIDTVGHDPILGFIFGVIDIIRGTSTKVKEGSIEVIKDVTEGKGIVEAVIIQFLHLLSDVSTKRGLPVPFASVFRLLDVGHFKRANGKTATISELMGWMYHNGYDLRHFAVMGTTPAAIEIILRMYIMIRSYSERNDTEFLLGRNPKYRSMLLSAHSIASAANVGKVYLRQGNPLAINYAEWMALVRYLAPSIKYWMFDKAELELRHMESITNKEWDSLIQNGNLILENYYSKDLVTFELGEASEKN